MNGATVLVQCSVNTGKEQACDPRFKPGHSGNPAGRPKGSRNRLAEAFVAELCADFEQHGRSVIEDVRRSDPVAYLAIIAKLVPREPSDASDATQVMEVRRTIVDAADQFTRRIHGLAARQQGSSEGLEPDWTP